ncbi:MAG TPA: bifunctional UDP-N-acetylglucosamine diphosphorylase/glucosamine-1-phosphate N-acetyltransferase GlmU [Solirubrobacteraceae bacterium]|nr:bifunctional UDP-N-acetylglucosamine diphosphorylase/glucosamine-1-phosphate N-acetyltransferase GlmU [Solirubrobacteraceae bacterium]
MATPTVVILAAGQGTRMKSAIPKVLHDLCGWPLVRWPVEAARAAGAARVVVVGGPDRALGPVLPASVELAVQAQPRGTGDAVLSAAPYIDPDARVIVVAGDVPLISAEAIRGLADAHAAAGAAATMLTMVLDDASGYGRVVRAQDGSVDRVVETKVAGEATPEELAISEVNTGVFAFEGGLVLEALRRVRPDNAQGELYLPDALPALRKRGHAVAAVVTGDATLTLGVNDRADLAIVRALAQRRILDAHMRAGVTVLAPEATVVDASVAIGPDTVLELGTTLRGATRIGADCRIGPHATLTDARLGDAVQIVHSYGLDFEAQNGVAIGPFAYLRPGTVLRPGSKVGTFVEVKNSDVGAGTKVPHLSYVGDADIGERSNLGAGTITANYDGVHKHRTTIGDDVKGGVDTAFVAPVTVGDGAWTAAGSVVTHDVPPGALAVARARQRNVEDYARRKR